MCTVVSRQRDADIRLSQPKSTPTASQRSSQSSVSGTEDSSSVTDRKPPTALTNSKLNHQASTHSTSVDSRVVPRSSSEDNSNSTSMREQPPRPNARELGHTQVPAIKTPQIKRVQKASSDNMTEKAKSQSKKTQSLTPDQKIRSTVSGGSVVSISRSKQAPGKQLCLTAGSRSAPGNDEVTIARHKPTVGLSNNNTNVSTQHDTTNSGSAKDSNTERTSRQMAKPH